MSFSRARDKETAYLLHSPASARRLLEAIEELESGGGGQVRGLDDLDDGPEGPDGEWETT